MIPKILIVVAVAIGFGSAYEICKPGESGTFHRDYSSCRGYIVCNNGKGHPGTCKGNYLFNEVTRSCDFPYNVKCTLVCPKTGITAFRLPQSCWQYVSCAHGKATRKECPAGYLFDTRSKKCELMQKADCPNKDTHCPDPRVNSKFPSKQKCSAYYECFNGKPKLKNCANGLHFNSTTGGCDVPSVAKCPIVTNKKEHFNDIEIECPTTGTHFYPHPMNCHLYHICHNGVLKKMVCGQNLYYDMKSERCELAKRARCVLDALYQYKSNSGANTLAANGTRVIDSTWNETASVALGTDALDLMPLF